MFASREHKTETPTGYGRAEVATLEELLKQKEKIEAQIQEALKAKLSDPVENSPELPVDLDLPEVEATHAQDWRDYWKLLWEPSGSPLHPIMPPCFGAAVGGVEGFLIGLVLSLLILALVWFY